MMQRYHNALHAAYQRHPKLIYAEKINFRMSNTSFSIQLQFFSIFFNLYNIKKISSVDSVNPKLGPAASAHQLPAHQAKKTNPTQKNVEPGRFLAATHTPGRCCTAAARSCSRALRPMRPAFFFNHFFFKSKKKNPALKKKKKTHYNMLMLRRHFLHKIKHIYMLNIHQDFSQISKHVPNMIEGIQSTKTPK